MLNTITRQRWPYWSSRRLTKYLKQPRISSPTMLRHLCCLDTQNYSAFVSYLYESSSISQRGVGRKQQRRLRGKPPSTQPWEIKLHPSLAFIVQSLLHHDCRSVSFTRCCSHFATISKVYFYSIGRTEHFLLRQKAVCHDRHQHNTKSAKEFYSNVCI